LIETGFGLWVVALQLSASGLLYSGGKATIMSLLYLECRMIRQSKWVKTAIWQSGGVGVTRISGVAPGFSRGEALAAAACRPNIFALGGGLF
jgi:hypothetical protein